MTVSIEDRLTRVEAQLDRIAQLLEQQRASAIGQATQAASGALVNIYGEEEIQERVSEFVLRLGEPETLEALTRIGVLLPQLEYALQFAAGGPELLEEGLDMVREWGHESGHSPHDLKRRMQAVMDAMEQLSEPKTLAAVAALSAQLPGLVSTVEQLASAAQRIDLEPLVRVGEAAASPEVSKALVQLMNLAPNLAPAFSSLPIQQRTLQVLRSLNESVENAAKLERREGLFGTMRALGDPSVQRAVGFLLNVAAQLGDHLEGKRQLPPTT